MRSTDDTTTPTASNMVNAIGRITSVLGNLADYLDCYAETDKRD